MSPAEPAGKFIVIVPAVVFKKYPLPVTPVIGESPVTAVIGESHVTLTVVTQSTVPVLPKPV